MRVSSASDVIGLPQTVLRALFFFSFFSLRSQQRLPLRANVTDSIEASCQRRCQVLPVFLGELDLQHPPPGLGEIPAEAASLRIGDWCLQALVTVLILG